MQHEAIRKACTNQICTHPDLKGVKEWLNLIVTWEPLRIGKTGLRGIVGEAAAQTLLLSVEELETLQPFFAKGHDPFELLENILDREVSPVVNPLTSSTGIVYGDSYLIKFDDQLYASLGV